MRLVELLNFRAPEGFHATVNAEAHRRGITFAELIRRAVAKDLAEADRAVPDPRIAQGRAVNIGSEVEGEAV
ncbi:hypothetical protein [Xanthobacter autotrophicus]|uniref:hypothetical protein n=1 Tax=Xanthobacter autotrophicus TaxID=280 RepID=UPI00372C455A